MIPYRLVAGLAIFAAIFGGGAWWLHNQKQAAYDAGFAVCDAANTKAALDQTTQIRAKESVLINKNAKVNNDYKAENDRLRADAGDARRLLDTLQAASISASTTDTSTSTGIIDPYPRAFVECAVALTEVDKEYQRIRGVAQALQGYAREVCVSDLIN